LENLYKKITGHELIYTALVGKPSEITYYHAEKMVVTNARQLGFQDPIRRLYAIGYVFSFIAVAVYELNY